MFYAHMYFSIYFCATRMLNFFHPQLSMLTRPPIHMVFTATCDVFKQGNAHCLHLRLKPGIARHLFFVMLSLSGCVGSLLSIIGIINTLLTTVSLISLIGGACLYRGGATVAFFASETCGLWCGLCLFQYMLIPSVTNKWPP